MQPASRAARGEDPSAPQPRARAGGRSAARARLGRDPAAFPGRASRRGPPRGNPPPERAARRRWARARRDRAGARGASRGGHRHGARGPLVRRTPAEAGPVGPEEHARGRGAAAATVRSPSRPARSSHGERGASTLVASRIVPCDRDAGVVRAPMLFDPTSRRRRVTFDPARGGPPNRRASGRDHRRSHGPFPRHPVRPRSRDRGGPGREPPTISKRTDPNRRPTRASRLGAAPIPGAAFGETEAAPRSGGLSGSPCLEAGRKGGRPLYRIRETKRAKGTAERRSADRTDRSCGRGRARRGASTRIGPSQVGRSPLRRHRPRRAEQPARRAPFPAPKRAGAPFRRLGFPSRSDAARRPTAVAPQSP